MRDHVLFGGLMALGLSPWLGIGGALSCWVTTVFIDVDHHVMFIWRGGWRSWWRVDRMLRYVRAVFESAPDRTLVALDPFHTLEVLVLLTAMAMWQPSAWWQGIGCGAWLHFITDMVHQARHGRAFTRAYSWVEYLLRRRRLAAEGLDPDRLFNEAVQRACASA